MEACGEIIVLPFFGQGHLNPCLELCKQIASQKFKAIFIIPSDLSSSIPSFHHPLVEVVQLSSPSPPPEPAAADGPDSEPIGPHHARHRRPNPMAQGIENFLSERFTGPGQARPLCAVVDAMMRWSKDIFVKLNIPTVAFFTSGACTSAMEYAKWKADADNIKPGEIRILPGLPENMALSYADIKRNQRRIGGREARDASRTEPLEPETRARGEPRPDGRHPVGGRPGPPGPGRRTPWWEDVEGSKALLLNTCDDLEGLFIKYISEQIGIPVWGVGPMLPEQYWKSGGSVVHDHEVRSNKDSSVTEKEVIEWLNAKPEQSVIYISFGSEVSPTSEELCELADALEGSNRAFIWVVPPGSGTAGPPRSIKSMMGRNDDGEEGYYPHGLDDKVGSRGFIIKGWAPQLLILSHPSVGVFLSHCGWNSTVEAIGRGVAILAWPIRGDQFYNAKLIVKHLKVGHTLLTSDDPFETMKKDQILRGIEMVMEDQEVHKRATQLADRFQGGHPASSVASLRAFLQLLSH